MATVSQIGIPAAGFGFLQPKMKNKWQVTFTGLAALVSSANSRDLTRQAINVDRPNLDFEELPIHRYNSTAYVAGKYTWDPLSLVVEDDMTGLASAALQGQAETQQRLIGGDLPGNWLNTAATGSDYKFGLTLQLLDGNEGVIEEWLYEGCWFKNIKFNTMAYESSDIMTIDLTLRFDHARQILTGQGYGTALGGFL